jgi:hypothetical protein
MIGSKCYSSSYYFGVELRARVVEWEKKSVEEWRTAWNKDCLL